MAGEERRVGKVVAVSLSDSRAYPKFPQDKVIIGKHGVYGDAHSGQLRPSHKNPGTMKPNDRAVSVVAREVLDDVNLCLGLTMQPGNFNENILVEGLGDLSDVQPGEQLVFGSGVVLNVTAQNDPCIKLQEYNGRGVVQATVAKEDGRKVNRRGIVATVSSIGILQPGDEVELRKKALAPFDYAHDLTETTSVPTANQEFEPTLTGEMRAEAFAIINQLADIQVIYRARFIADVLEEAIGIPHDSAIDLVSQYYERRDQNTLSGGITSLPEVSSEEIIERRTDVNSKEARVGWFVFGYATYALFGESELGLEYSGKYWLGNTPQETIELLQWMEQNGEAVGKYLHAFLQQPKGRERVDRLFNQRLKKGKLKRVDFTEEFE